MQILGPLLLGTALVATALHERPRPKDELIQIISREIKRGAEPYEYFLKFARMNLTPEEQRSLKKESEKGGFEAFKKALDRMAAGRGRRGRHPSVKGLSLKEYIKYHAEKERDVR